MARPIRVQSLAGTLSFMRRAFGWGFGLVVGLVCAVSGAADPVPEGPQALVQGCIDASPDVDVQTRCIAQARLRSGCSDKAQPPFDMMACIRARPGRDAAEASQRWASCSDQRTASEADAREAMATCNGSFSDALADRFDAYRTGLSECTTNGTWSSCRRAGGGLANTCVKRCTDAREGQLHANVQAAQDACEAGFVAHGGRGAFACAMPFVADKGETEASVQTAFEQAHDGPSADAVVHRSEALFYRDAEPDCTKACRTRGPNLFAAQRDAPQLVVGYKRCMVAADSTREARKLAAYELTLYCDLLAKANAQCRSQSRCDWVETYTRSQCEYVSPGLPACGS
jgi:hypothetical protein